jgi:hypothetical protein
MYRVAHIDQMTAKVLAGLFNLRQVSIASTYDVQGGPYRPDDGQSSGWFVQLTTSKYS